MKFFIVIFLAISFAYNVIYTESEIVGDRTGNLQQPTCSSPRRSLFILTTVCTSGSEPVTHMLQGLFISLKTLKGSPPLDSKTINKKCP